MNIRNNRWLSVFTLLICRANKQTLKLLFLATVTSIGLNVVPAFAATGGTWVGAAEFGTFDLEVNVQGIGIERVDFQFSAFTCGPVTISGGIGFTPSAAWPISNGEFNITVTWPTEMAMTISGTFESATEAVGTWDAVFRGEQCTGTWEAMVDDPEAFTMNAGLNDAWYNPDTDGQGFFITVFPDLDAVSLAWFTYDTELPAEDATANLGNPGHRWLTAVGPIEGNQAIMEIEMTSGGLFDAATTIDRTDPPGSDGTITLTFTSCNSATVEYDIPSINRQGTVPIRRVANDNIVICEALSAD